MINFNPDTHTYSNVEGYIYDSPSKILATYKHKFPAPEAAKAYAKKHGGTPGYWLKEWGYKRDKALLRGNTIHAEKEDISLSRRVEKHQGTFMRVENPQRYFVTDLKQLPDGIYPEIDIWNNGWRIAGKPDKLIIRTIGNTRYADILDYKTNRLIREDSYKDINGQYKMMLAPVQHLKDSAMNHYFLQLSFYQYIMETHGFKPGVRQIIHIPHPFEGVMGEVIQPPEKIIEVPYLKEDILNILRDYDRKRIFDKLKQTRKQ